MISFGKIMRAMVGGKQNAREREWRKVSKTTTMTETDSGTRWKMRGRKRYTTASRRPKRNVERRNVCYAGEYLRTLDDGSLESQQWKHVKSGAASAIWKFPGAEVPPMFHGTP